MFYDINDRSSYLLRTMTASCHGILYQYNFVGVITRWNRSWEFCFAIFEDWKVLKYKTITS